MKEREREKGRLRAIGTEGSGYGHLLPRAPVSKEKERAKRKVKGKEIVEERSTEKKTGKKPESGTGDRPESSEGRKTEASGRRLIEGNAASPLALGELGSRCLKWTLKTYSNKACTVKVANLLGKSGIEGSSLSKKVS